MSYSSFSDDGGSNRQAKGDKNTAKLDRETEELHHDTVGLDVSKLIQLGRSEKKLTQKDLATVSMNSVYSLCLYCMCSSPVTAFVDEVMGALKH